MEPVLPYRSWSASGRQLAKHCSKAGSDGASSEQRAALAVPCVWNQLPLCGRYSTAVSLAG
jgi:hypothetical protein